MLLMRKSSGNAGAKGWDNHEVESGGTKPDCWRILNQKRQAACCRSSRPKRREITARPEEGMRVYKTRGRKLRRTIRKGQPVQTIPIEGGIKESGAAESDRLKGGTWGEDT